MPYGQRYKLSPEQLAAILKKQHAAFMRVAGHISIAHEWLEDIKDRCSDATGSDPFTAADKVRGGGIENLVDHHTQQVSNISSYCPTLVFRLGRWRNSGLPSN